MIEDYLPFGKTSGGILTRSGNDVVYIRSLDGFRLERKIVERSYAAPPGGYKPIVPLHTVHFHTPHWFYQASIEDFVEHGELLQVKGRPDYLVLPVKYFLVIDRDEILRI